LVYDDLKAINNQILTPFFTAFVTTNISTNMQGQSFLLKKETKWSFHDKTTRTTMPEMSVSIKNVDEKSTRTRERAYSACYPCKLI